MEALLYADVLLACFEYPTDQFVDNGVVQVLFEQVISFPESSVLELFLQLKDLHFNSPAGKLAYKTEARTGQRVIEKLRLAEDPAAQRLLGFFE